MSDAPREARSFERITNEDLARLAEIGVAALADTCRPGNKSHVYADRLQLLCFCQGAALHHRQSSSPNTSIEDWRGIHDFDVWGFFRIVPGQRFSHRTLQERDFGPSRFGKSPGDGKREGRKVDVAGRAIDVSPGEDPVDAVLRWVRSGPGSSPKLIRQRPIYVLSPGAAFGTMIWHGD